MAEVAIAFTGFSGVVGVFGGGSALSEAERMFRVRVMIERSLAAFFGALLPLAMFQFDSMAELVWLLLCPLLGAYVLFGGFNVYRRTRILAVAGNYSKPWFAPILYSVSLLLALALFAAAFGLLPGHSVYIVGLIWQLVLASTQFLFIVVQTRPSCR